MLDDAITAIDAYIETLRADGSIPGLVLGVTDRNGLLFDRQYGYAELATKRAVEPEHLFEIGSIGKTFCAVIIMQLVEEGRLHLDDPAVQHLPWFSVPRTGERITIRHLLSHTAGITAGVDGTPEDTFQVWRLRDLTPSADPGQRFHYSNVGYKTLGLIIERLEGAPYPDVLRRRVLEPLGMTASEPAITNDIRPRLAIGYEPPRDDIPWSEGDPLMPATWLETDTADGAIASTAADMATFARMLLNEGAGPAGRLISAESFAHMVATVPSVNPAGYGLGIYARDFGDTTGFAMDVVDGRRLIGHTGGMVGYIAGLWCDPESGLGAVVLQNGPGHGPSRLCRQILRVMAAALDGRDPAAELDGIVAAQAAADAADDSEATETTATTTVDSPTPPDPALAAIVGTYRSHDPWTPTFRIVLRGHVPWLVFPWAPDGFDDEQPLVELEDGNYRVGKDPLGPERVSFDTVIDGRMARAWLSGWDYYRTGDA
jgi:D-alanyl-D-alanine carboxypeptidase